MIDRARSHDDFAAGADPLEPLTVLIVMPTLQAGAADSGVVELVRILASAGHEPIVVSRGGRLAAVIKAAGGDLIELDMASHNPAIDASQRVRNGAHRPRAPLRRHPCAWPRAGMERLSAPRMTGMPFVTTWYKGFRQQNAFKRLYNGVMARGDRVIAVSDQIAELINDRYGTPWDRIAVVPRASTPSASTRPRSRATASTPCAALGASARRPS